jgi:hypothetical protein
VRHAHRSNRNEQMPCLLLNILAPLSLLLCGATMTLWLRTFHTMDSFEAYHGKNAYGIDSCAGRLILVRSVGGPYETNRGKSGGWEFHLAHQFQEIDYDDVMGRWTRYGFGNRRIRFVLDNSNSPPTHTVYFTAIPHALPAIVFAILPAYTIFNQTRKRRRKRTGRCITCGYDLRASRDRCPECGVAIPAFSTE